MAKVFLFLADGFEEIEGLTVVDVLRRGDVDITTVSVTGKPEINGSHGIKVMADILFENADFSEGDMAVLPGGLRGTAALIEHSGVAGVIKEYYEAGKYVAAICAAPTVLGKYGILTGKRATCYPGKEEQLFAGEYVSDEKVVRDGKVITSRGMGTSLDFALALLKELAGEERMEKVGRAVLFI